MNNQKKEMIIINDNTFDCFETVIATVLNYFGRDFWPMFLNTWNFSFNDKDDNIMKNISPNSGNYFRTILMEFLGLNLIEDTPLDEHDFILSQLRNGMPVIIKTDAYYIPWSKSYNKYHYRHYFLIKGYDSEKGEYTYADPFCGIKQEVLPAGHMENYAKECISVYLNHSPHNEKITDKLYSFLLVRRDNAEGAINQLLNFHVRFSDVIKDKNAAINLEEEDIISLGQITNERINYSAFLANQERYTAISFDYEISMLKNLARKWNKFKMYLIKLSVRKTFDELIVKLLNGLIDEIIREEKIITDKLISKIEQVTKPIAPYSSSKPDTLVEG